VCVECNVVHSQRGQSEHGAERDKVTRITNDAVTLHSSCCQYGCSVNTANGYVYCLFIFSGCAAQRGLWPPVAVQPSAGYGLLWLCSPARAMASCGCAAQRGLWPPVAVQPSAGYGLLWLCSPARAMASSSTRLLGHTQCRATVGRTPLDE
jgi:hypothetical protein